MPVTSTLEMYTSLLGWHLYNGIWGLLVSTGLILLPFVITVVSVLRDTASTEGVTARELIRTLESKLYLMLGVLFFAVQPHIYLYTENTSFLTSSCAVDGSAAKPEARKFGDTGTTYDYQADQFTAMLDGRTAKIPVWWYFFGKLNVAIAVSLKNELPCKPDLRGALTSVSNLKLSDNNLKQEVQQFYNDCYLPAANKFQREQLAKSEIPSALRDTIAEDVAWMGSEFFVSQSGYYDQLRPSSPIKAMPYSDLRGDNVKGPDLGGIKGPDGKIKVAGPGWPTCDAWWKDKDDGLRKRVLADAKSGEFGLQADKPLYEAVIGKLLPSTKSSEDLLIKQAVYAPTNAPSIEAPLSTESQGPASWNQKGALSDFFATTGLSLKMGLARVETDTYRAAGPIVQALVLMMFTLLLPLLMAFSLFDLGTLLRLTIVQFSIVFWTFLFALAAWIDNFLLNALLLTAKNNISDGVLYRVGDSILDQSTEVKVIDWIVMFGYVALPILFSMFMNMVGRNLSLSVGQAFDAVSGNAGQASTSSASLAQNAAISAVTSAAGRGVSSAIKKLNQ